MFLQQYLDIKDRYMSMKNKGKIKQIPTFLLRLSTLLEEGYTFSDSITMLLPFHTEKIDYWNTTIHERLRSGEDVASILRCFSIPQYYLIAIKIAEENGDMARALKNIAIQMEFNEKMQKKLIKLLSYPLLLFVVLTCVFISFRTYFLPNIQGIIHSRTDEQTSNIGLSNILLRLPDVLFLSILLITFGLFICSLYFKRQTVQQRLILFLKIPVVNYFYKLLLTRELCRGLGSLLVSGFSLQQALNILQQQQFNKLLAYVSSEIEKHIIYGDSLSHCVSVIAWFFPKFEEFIKHGEKNGHLGRELLIYCDLLDEKLQNIIKTGIAVVQPLLFIIIAICIIAAYLSVLLPMYEIIEIL
ncbi:competence type IV pilus assembly protein ComGB [Lysinibacillus endophyticus]|uniref:competence type IV pilus assembly protein ComGB n=1 Tax=Ureibacillus endophyticus TaxID=1978490 RepID=UPI00209E4844|nr:competence type IV pilus assembly protein ComGB [Lysinibacillus endophyticus]MCP1145221.1 type II secretion system F family protein [Lysinibacillus endophyticus]